jgi:NADH:ubiquinone oxidoreductase subunit E
MTKKSSQPSALSFQLGPNKPLTVCSTQAVLTANSSLGVVSPTLHSCRIVCDENEDDFRLALCRTFCAGACPGAQGMKPEPSSHKKPAHFVAEHEKRKRNIHP